MRTLIAVLVLLALASTGLASTGLVAHPVRRAPTRFLRVELLDVGAMAMPVAEHFRALRFDYEFGQWRAGVSAFDMGNMLFGDENGYSPFGGYIVPDVGYRLYGRPRRTAFFYSMVPSIWVEAAASFRLWPTYSYTTARMDCRAEVDYYGVGLGMEGGVIAGTMNVTGRFFWPYVRLGIILGVANFGL